MSTPFAAAPAAVAAPWRIPEPADAEFRRFADLVESASGISLNESKRALVMRRVSNRMRQLGLERLGDYAAAIARDASGAELVRMLDLIATNETHFFREPQHFQFLAQWVVPEWVRGAAAGTRARKVRVWSAACSTGQEPYSLAMQLLLSLPPSDGWEVEIVATDISTHALDIAMRAEWPIEKAAEIPENYRKRFMLRGIRDQVGRMRATPELRASVQFQRMNLSEESYPVQGTFDLIFCRNVLIYFSPEGRAAVIERLADRLSPSGLLFVGHAESLHAHRGRLRPVMPTIYGLVG